MVFVDGEETPLSGRHGLKTVRTEGSSSCSIEKEHTRATEPAFVIDLSMPIELKLKEEVITVWPKTEILGK